MLFLLIKIVVGTNTISYIYNATGQKVSKIVNEATNITQTNYLAGGFQYKNNVLQFFPHAEGYVKHEANNYSYVFNYTDHLGNVRVSYSDIDKNGSLGGELNVESCETHYDRNGNPYTICNTYFTDSILEESHYYPFGLKHSGYNMNNSQPNYAYKYNGKELQTELGLNMYDYGARRYQADIGRWTTIDPAANEYVGISPYSYAANNPMVFTDPDGKRLFFVGGANNDQDGWEYITRWGNYMTDAGIKNFVRVNASNGKMGDVMFTNTYRSSGTYYESVWKKDPGGGSYREYTGRELPQEHNAIDRAVDQMTSNLEENPLEEGEQFNLAGYSYGSVLQAQAALRLANDGQYIDNLILIGSPIADDSKLMKQLKGNKNIGNVLRVDIEGDLLSNPKDILEFIKGGAQNSSDDGPHFDLARPGDEANSLIQTVIQWLQQQGVE